MYIGASVFIRTCMHIGITYMYVYTCVCELTFLGGEKQRRSVYLDIYVDIFIAVSNG